MQENPFSSESSPAGTPAPVNPSPAAAPPVSSAQPFSPSPLPQTDGILRPGPAVNQDGEVPPAVTGQEAGLVRTLYSGTNWFFWIAGLTLVNTVLAISGSDTTFGLGLGVTLLTDFISQDLVQKHAAMAGAIRVVQFGFDILAIGLTVLWGILGRKGQNWAIMVGGVLVALDTLLLGLITLSAGGGLIISILIHIWALFGIFGAFGAGRKLAAIARERMMRQGPNPWSATSAG